MNLNHDFSNSKLTFTFQDGVIIEFNLTNCLQPIRDRLALHGAVQMVGAKIHQSEYPESAYELADDAIAYIQEDYPEKKSIKTPRGLLIEAIARIKGCSEQEIAEIWNQLSSEKRKEAANRAIVKAQITVIRGQRAERCLNLLEQNADKNPEKDYSHHIDLENHKAHFVISGQELTLDLALVKNVEALALYGAEQKICDSFAGIKNDPEKRIKAEKIIQNLYSGNWSSRGGSSQQEAGPSLLDKQLTDQLREWMRWQKDATMIALGKFDEQEKARLLHHPDAKELLILVSREFKMEHNSTHCSQGDIVDLLAEVLERIDSSRSA